MRNASSLYRAHAPALRRYLVRLTADGDVAEDALHDTFARLLDSPPRHQTNLRAWLFTTATNVVRDGGRRARRVEAFKDLDLPVHRPAPLGEDPLVAVERRELRARLHSALATLSERERVAILMREEGFTHREIAKALSSTTGTIGTLLARALRKLALALPLDGEDR